MVRRARVALAVAALVGPAACSSPDLDRLEAASFCDPAWRLCSGLEAPLAGRLRVQLEGDDDPLLEIDDTFAFRGAGSMHAVVPHDGGDGGARYYDGNADIDDPVLDWARFFVFIPDPEAYRAALMWLIRAEEPYSGVLLGLGDGGAPVVKSYSDDGFSELAGAVRVEPSTWTCVELRVSPGQPVGLFLDGVEVPDVAPPPEARSSPLTQVYIGPQHDPAPPGPPAEAWFDELVLSDDRVGCDR